MGSIRARPQNGKLFFDFRYRGQRCREQTALDDTPVNRKKAKQVLDRIEAEITLGTFDYARYFPNSANAADFAANDRQGLSRGETPLFRDFAENWFEEMKVQWRNTHIANVRLTLRKYLNPTFGEKEVGHITKADILEFRSSLAKVTTATWLPIRAGSTSTPCPPAARSRRGRADWTHANAIAYNPRLDQILLSFRNTGEIYIIDHSTTTAQAAGHTGGRYGHGGDFLYR